MQISSELSLFFEEYYMELLLFTPISLLPDVAPSNWSRLIQILHSKMSPSRKTMRASTIPFLPQEILIQILTRLPAKTLVRFKCVSKLFCSLITDPLFTDLHRNWSLTLPGRTSILICLPSPTSMTAVYYTINYIGENQGNLLANSVLYLDTEPMNRAGLLSSANGMLCLFKGHDIAICNLCTGTHIFLPRILVPLRSASTLLGFDPISKKYKALKSGECVDHLGSVTLKHWVFTLGVDTSWREINCADSYFPTESFYYSHTSVYIDGIIYSLNRLDKYPCLVPGFVPSLDIAAFDVGAENFHTISIPDGLLYRYGIEIWSLEKSMEWGKRRTISIPLEGNQIINTNDCLLRLATSRFGEILLLIVTRQFPFYCMNWGDKIG